MAADIQQFWQAVETATDPTAYKPARHTAVTATRLTNRDETYYVLKQPERKNYVRLSEADFALWWQMDGRRRIKDLLFYSLKRYKSLPVGHFTTVVSELRQGGFLQDQPVNLYDQIESQLQARAPESQGRRLLKGFLHTEIARSGLDPLFTRLYGWTRPLFHPLAQIMLLLLVLSGGVLFALLYNRHVYTLTSSGYVAALSLILANLIVIGLHELAHALTTKHIGRELDRGGFLLYWGLPAFFVDTRDTWLATSHQRILVSWAGPYSGLMLGGLLGWVLTAVTYFIPTAADTIWATFLYQMAFLAYFSVLINLNPLLELDGYFILMDWLEMPGLRGRAFRFWREELWGKVRASTGPRQLWRELAVRERIFLLFGALAFFYSAFALWLAVNFWRLRLVPFAETLWANGFWGRVTLVLLTAVVLIPTAYFLGLLLWSRAQTALRWLANRDLLARPDVLALLIGGPILVGLPLLWLLLGRLPAGHIWQPIFVWLLYLAAAVELAFVAWQLTGSRFQWALWALAAAPLSLSLAYLAAGLTTSIWRDLALMLAAATILASGIVAWFTINPRWLTRADRWLMAGMLLVGLLTFAALAQVEGSDLFWGNGRWLAAAFITSCTTFGLTFMAPLLLNFWRSRFALPWALLAVVIALTPWLLPFPALATPLLALWLFAATLYLLLGLLAQFARHELAATALTGIGTFGERDRLVVGFNHFMTALFASYEAVFGGRRLAAIQGEIVSAGPLDRDLSILQIAERARHALLLAVDRLDDLAGTPFTRQAGQAAYDSLPWLEAETVARHVLSRTQWGAGLAQGFIRARDHRLELIRQADIFAGLDWEGMQAVTAVLQVRAVRKNGVLAQAGQEATHFYLVDSGEVGIFHNGEQVATLHSGGYFGTGALAGRGQHSFTYRALTTAVLFTIHRDDFDPLLRADTTLAQQVSSGAQTRSLLRRMSLFSGLSPQELAALDARLQKRHVAAGELFVRQGEPRSFLFIIVTGVVELSITEQGEEQVIGTLGPGEHFGEYALFADTPYHANGRARLDVELLLLDEAKFDELVAHCEQMTQYVEQLGSGRLLAAQRHTALPS